MADDIRIGQYYAQQAYHQQAQDFYNALARGALTRRYGPEYNNPEMALQAAQANEISQMTPLHVSGERRRLNYLAQSYPLQLIQQQNQNALGQEQVTQAQQTTQQNQGVINRQPIYGMVEQLYNDVNSGKDPGQAFDERAAQVAPMLGTTPYKLAAQYRGDFVRNPHETISMWMRSLQGIEYGIMPATQRVQGQVAMAKLAGDLQKLETEKQQTASAYYKAQGVTDPRDALSKAAAFAGYRDRMGVEADPAKGTPATGTFQRIDRVVSALQNPNLKGVAWRTAMQYLPAQEAKTLQADIESVMDDAKVFDIQNMAATGFKGLPRSTAAMEASGKALLNININMKTDDIVARINSFREALRPVSQQIGEHADRAREVYDRVKAYEDKSVTPPSTITLPQNPSLQSPFARIQQSAAPQQIPTPATNTAAPAMPATNPAATQTPTYTPQQIQSLAAEAIRRGAPRDKVLQRVQELLRQQGITNGQ